MRRAALLLVLACAATALPATSSTAGFATVDVYRSDFLAVDRDGRTYEIGATVEDRPAGAQLVVEVRRRCDSCRAAVYAKTLAPGDLIVRQVPTTPECQCMSATVSTKFGGKPLTIDWVWDPEQGASPSGGGVQWTAVTANTLMNVSCFGSGTVTSTPDPLSGDEPARPERAKEFPKKLPPAFRADLIAAPGCYVEWP
jgi:hypothetical protein